MTPEWRAIQAYRHDVADEIARLESTVTSGFCPSFEDYRHKTGRIEGLKDSLRRLDETIKTYVEDDADE